MASIFRDIKNIKRLSLCRRTPKVAAAFQAGHECPEDKRILWREAVILFQIYIIIGRAENFISSLADNALKDGI